MDANVASAARLLKRRRGRGGRLPPLILMTDERRLPDPIPTVSRLPAGSGVILRHYTDSKRAGLARRLAAICRQRRLLFIVAGDPRLALAVRAQGLHLPERDLGRPVLPAARRLILTASAHSWPALVAAWRRGARAALLGPVFATQSHPGVRGLGVLRFAALARRSPVPAYALGGVTGRNARRLAGSGAAGIAGISALAETL